MIKRTIGVVFRGENFRMPRRWNPAQVADFLQHWQQNRTQGAETIDMSKHHFWGRMTDLADFTGVRYRRHSDGRVTTSYYRKGRLRVTKPTGQTDESDLERVAQAIWQMYAAEVGRALPAGCAERLAHAAINALKTGQQP